MDLLTARMDKTYSLCDAVSFILMRERGLSEALTTDKHFCRKVSCACLNRNSLEIRFLITNTYEQHRTR